MSCSCWCHVIGGPATFPGFRNKIKYSVSPLIQYRSDKSKLLKISAKNCFLVAKWRYLGAMEDFLGAKGCFLGNRAFIWCHGAFLICLYATSFFSPPPNFLPILPFSSPLLPFTTFAFSSLQTDNCQRSG